MGRVYAVVGAVLLSVPALAMAQSQPPPTQPPPPPQPPTQPPPQQHYSAQQRAALEYYARHSPEYYARHYGSMQPAPPPAAEQQPPPQAGAGPPGVTLPAAGMVMGETAENGDRTLRAHTFHYPRLITNAFTAANFFVGTSVELYHQADRIARFENPGGGVTQLNYNLDLAFVRVRYGVDFQLASPFTIGLDADYLAEVGANETSLFLHGGQTGFDFRPNIKWRLYRNEDTGSQLAFGANASFRGGVRAVPQGLLADLSAQALAGALNFQTLDFEGMSVSRGRNAGGVTLAYAQALGAAAGLQIAVGGEAGRKTVSNSRVGDVDATSMSFHAGLAPSLNFAPSFPIGLTLEYRFELDRDTYDGNELAEVEPGSETVAKGHRFGAGLYYTGRRDLMLGWIGGLALLEDREAAIGSVTETPDAPDAVLLSAQFDMRYFF